MINMPVLHVGDTDAGDRETRGGDVKANLNEGNLVDGI